MSQMSCSTNKWEVLKRITVSCNQSKGPLLVRYAFQPCRLYKSMLPAHSHFESPPEKCKEETEEDPKRLGDRRGNQRGSEEAGKPQTKQKRI